MAYKCDLVHFSHKNISLWTASCKGKNEWGEDLSISGSVSGGSGGAREPLDFESSEWSP